MGMVTVLHSGYEDLMRKITVICTMTDISWLLIRCQEPRVNLHVCFLTQKLFYRGSYYSCVRDQGTLKDNGHQVVSTTPRCPHWDKCNLTKMLWESRAVASSLPPENLIKGILEGRSLVSRREAVLACVRGEVKSDSSAEELRYLPQMCHGEKRGAEEQEPSVRDSWRQLLPLSGAQCGLDSARPGPCTQFKSLFVKPLSVILYLEDLGGERGHPPQDCYPRCRWDLRPEQVGTWPPRPQALEAGPFLFLFLFYLLMFLNLNSINIHYWFQR